MFNCPDNNVTMQFGLKISFMFLMQNLISYFSSWFWSEIWHLTWSQDSRTSLSFLKQLFFLWSLGETSLVWFKDNLIVISSSQRPANMEEQMKAQTVLQMMACHRCTYNSKLTWKKSATLMFLNLKQHQLFQSTKVTKMCTQ